MATTVIVEIKAKPGVGDELLNTLEALLPDTRGYDGCIGLDTYRNQDDSNVLVLVSQWQTRGHYEKYLAWREEIGTFEQIDPMIDRPPSVRYFDSLEM